LATGNTDIISTIMDFKVVVETMTCLEEKKAKAEKINWVIILPRI
jgi:hypothetical protein